MAAGLGFKDFTTGEVLTAADVDGYLMQGIWVFADATARDAAVTSPQEGNACYLKDTNEVLTYSGSAWVAVGGGSPLTTKGDLYTYSTTDARLAVGANDTVLVADSSTATGLKWAAPASGGMTLISTTTLSGASIALTSIPATYVHLQVIIRDFLPANDGAELRMRINNNVTANRTRNLNWSDGPGTQNFNDDFWEISSSADNAVTQNLTILDIYDYTNTVTWKYGTSRTINVDQTTNTSVSYRFTNNVFNQTGAIDRLDFYCNTGNLTSGTVLLYGVK